MEEVYRFTKKQLRWLIFLIVITITVFAMKPYRDYVYQAYCLITNNHEEVRVESEPKPKPELKQEAVVEPRTIAPISTVPGWTKEMYEAIDIALFEVVDDEIIYGDGTLYEDVLKMTPKPTSIFINRSVRTGPEVTLTWEAPVEAEEKGAITIIFDQETGLAFYKSSDFEG